MSAMRMDATARTKPIVVGSKGRKRSHVVRRGGKDAGGIDWDTRESGGSFLSALYVMLVGEQKAREAETDVRKQLADLDPGLNRTLISEGTTISQLYNQDKWQRHRSVNRYRRHLLNLFQSTVFRRIFKPCMLIVGMAVVAVLQKSVLPPQFVFTLSVVPFQLLGTALGLLLVFRTNSSYARFNEGRAVWGQCVAYCRDIARVACSYLPEGRRDPILKYVELFPFALKSALRSGRSRSNANDDTKFRDDPSHKFSEIVDKDLCEEILESNNYLLDIENRMSCLVSDAVKEGAIPLYAAREIERAIAGLGLCAGGCERILTTPIPLSYTRHISRSVMIWLLGLPFALAPSMGYVAIPTMFFVSYILFGIDEIGIEIEEPFCVLPLLPLCQAVQRDIQVCVAASEKHSMRQQGSVA
mmetsp:Transcript_10965/g.67847  ORF Transcript_10965/g.67847 Transcript_10965/m.67847 type:complete len:414 (-) Transcript_10965:1655-2896(-)